VLAHISFGYGSADECVPCIPPPPSAAGEIGLRLGARPSASPPRSDQDAAQTRGEAPKERPRQRVTQAVSIKRYR
jgi:hypothetical protein